MTLALRPVTEEDAPTLLRWRNQPEVARQMFTDHTIGPEEHAAWLARALARDDAIY
jgi:UDP-4-amino-4,6-dideoxy-N-acetyl-beta-L-altrosamine N-acetyltransferase